MIKYLNLLLVLLLCGSSYAQLQSPEKFFGHEKGQKFVFHSRLVQYYEHLSQQKPDQAQLSILGYTAEGRPQLGLIISSAKNIEKLENIRQQHLRNIGLLPSNAIDANLPVICYLSYNVHGNESVSANAAPYVAYDLLSGKLDKELENQIVIIDPCVNPDGYDRYTQWYNRYQSVEPDLHEASVEHHEPWPGGRFNHYLFDMNRDVAWQVQQESKNRVKFYNSWMPHVHADFHEMGPNSTYYFPPSAKPFHEDISEYQRQFQTKWGDFNKKRFDANGWLYYTKENFDLLYPSYADTYPTYNGAAGATFEQGGSGSAGLAYRRQDGDILSLRDRIDHTIANSYSTIEATADRQKETIEKFITYFQEPIKKGYGKHKTFIIKTKGYEHNAAELCKLLERLQINYSLADKNTSLKGLNFESQKEENFSLENQDLIINTYQPKGVLTKILFEPKTMVEDSNTYDITSWALPYAFDLKAYALAQKIEGKSEKFTLNSTPARPTEIYAFAIQNTSFSSTRLLAALFKEQIKVRIHEKGFKVGGRSFGPGSLVVTKKGNEKLGTAFETLVHRHLEAQQIDYMALKSGLVEDGPDLGSDYVNALDAPKVGLIMGQGISPTAVGDVWHYFEQQLHYPLTLIDGSYFRSVDLAKINVLILVDGSYSNIIKDQKVLADWVEKGGRLILMEAANDFLAGKEGWGLKGVEKKEESKAKTDKKYADRYRDYISDMVTGVIYDVKLDSSHPLAYGYGPSMKLMVKKNLNTEFLKEGWNVGKTDSSSHLGGFVGARAAEGQKNKLVFGVEEKGSGKVIYMVESPIFRGFWHAGKKLLANAVFFVN
jgi:hypothetical protein